MEERESGPWPFPPDVLVVEAVQEVLPEVEVALVDVVVHTLVGLPGVSGWLQPTWEAVAKVLGQARHRG